MSRELILFPEAEEEASEAAAWYEREQVGLGLEFLAELDRVFERIVVGPRQFAAWESSRRFRRAVVSRFPYVIFFTERDNAVEVVAVAPGRRRPGYWRHRRRSS